MRSFRDMLDGIDLGKEGLSQLDEAAFSAKNLEKVVKLYSAILGRDFGGPFKPIGIEDYSRKMGPGKGFRVMNDKGRQLRFNWDAKLAAKDKESKNYLTSIDYWDERNTDFQKPTRTVTIPGYLNVIQILGTVSDALKTGRINEEYLEEGRSSDEKRAWLQQHGLPLSAAGSEKSMAFKAAAKGLTTELAAFLGTSETNSFAQQLNQGKKLLDKQVYANPETVFEDIEDLLSVVAAGKWRTLIVCGQGGIGKCLQADQTVNIKGLNF